MVTMTYIKLLLALTIIFGDARVLSNSDRAVVFAVQQEIQSNHFEKRNDVCVGFDPTLKSVEKRIRLRIEKAKYETCARSAGATAGHVG